MPELLEVADWLARQHQNIRAIQLLTLSKKNCSSTQQYGACRQRTSASSLEHGRSARTTLPRTTASGKMEKIQWTTWNNVKEGSKQPHERRSINFLKMGRYLTVYRLIVFMRVASCVFELVPQRSVNLIKILFLLLYFGKWFLYFFREISRRVFWEQSNALRRIGGQIFVVR